ncbi:MAG: hypothetical protein ABSH20_26130, partial [Tepidisphaeraceae bacterium]
MKANERMKIQRQHMPARDANERAQCFQEVNLGMAEQFAVVEAQRCLDCKDPKCINGCPVAIRIPRFVMALSQGNLRSAADILLEDNALPGISGRVCPQEKQCECLCIRGKKGDPVAIGYLERFVADWA